MCVFAWTPTGWNRCWVILLTTRSSMVATKAASSYRPAHRRMDKSRSQLKTTVPVFLRNRSSGCSNAFTGWIRRAHGSRAARDWVSRSLSTLFRAMAGRCGPRASLVAGRVSSSRFRRIRAACNKRCCNYVANGLCSCQLASACPDLFKGFHILAKQLGDVFIEDRQEDVVAIDVGVARHLFRNLRRVMPPLRLGVDL